jgi:hypothetical protein
VFNTIDCENNNMQIVDKLYVYEHRGQASIATSSGFRSDIPIQANLNAALVVGDSMAIAWI